MDVIREVCEQNQATLHEVWEVPAHELPSNLPLFQRRNWYLAWSAYEFLVDRDKLPQASEEKLAATTAAYIPARMEIIPLKAGKTLVLDGAHNAQKIAVLMKSLKARFPKATFAVMLSFGQNKDFQLRSSLAEITAVADHLIITSFGNPKDVYKTSINPIKIAEQCHVLGYDAWESISDTDKAYKALIKRPESVLLVTGSFYLLHGLRPLIEKSPKP